MSAGNAGEPFCTFAGRLRYSRNMDQRHYPGGIDRYLRRLAAFFLTIFGLPQDLLETAEQWWKERGLLEHFGSSEFDQFEPAHIESGVFAAFGNSKFN